MYMSGSANQIATFALIQCKPVEFYLIKLEVNVTQTQHVHSAVEAISMHSLSR